MMTDRPSRPGPDGTWVRLCKSVEVASRQGTRVELDIEHDLALFRINGTVHAVTNICPHKREAAIADGHVHNGTVTCPMHFWCFEISTGKNTATGGGLRTYPIEELNGYVWVLIPE